MVAYHLLLPSKPKDITKSGGVQKCVWCVGNAASRDHLVPRWMRRVLGASYEIGWRQERDKVIKRLDFRLVYSCLSCNQKKGPMPPAVFATLPRVIDGTNRVQKSCKEWQVATTEWLHISTYCKGLAPHELPGELWHYIVEAMAEPVVFGQPVRYVTKREKKTARWYADHFGDERSKATLSDVWPEVVAED